MNDRTVENEQDMHGYKKQRMKDIHATPGSVTTVTGYWYWYVYGMFGVHDSEIRCRHTLAIKLP